MPSNDAIARLEKVLNLADGQLFEAAGRPDNQALEFFRKGEASSIMRTLARIPANKLPKVREIIERFVAKNQRRKT